MALNIDRTLVTLAIETSATTATEEVFGISDIHGWAKTIKLVMPQLANEAVSGTFSVLDAEGATLWTKDVAQGTIDVTTDLEIPFAGGETIQLVLTAEPSGAGTDIDLEATVVLTTIP